MIFASTFFKNIIFLGWGGDSGFIIHVPKFLTGKPSQGLQVAV